MIRQHGKLTFLSFLLVVLCGNTFAQKIPVIPLDLDSLITVGYATGSLKTLSGSVEKITEKQMNKDQVTMQASTTSCASFMRSLRMPKPSATRPVIFPTTPGRSVAPAATEPALSVLMYSSCRM